MNPSFSVIIPAAGASSRMGTMKALLEHSPGKNFAEFITDGYKSIGCNPIVLVVSQTGLSNNTVPKGCEAVVNHHVHLGRSHSIQLGLSRIPAGNACFIHNIDNPFLEGALLEMLKGKLEPDGYVVPVFNGRGGHPVLMGSDVVAHLKGLEQLDDFKKEIAIFSRIDLVYPDQKICWNINTPEDYRMFMICMTTSPG